MSDDLFFGFVNNRLNSVTGAEEGADGSNDQLRTIYLQQKGDMDKRNVTIDNITYGKLRKYQSIDYNINKNQFNRMYLKYILTVSSIIFILLALWILEFIGHITAGVSIVLITIVFMTVAYLDFRKNAYRRNHDWNKFYFNAIVRSGDSANNNGRDACTLF